eukprot:TRINITY_DN27459_c0_g1_i1.p1 TRINITY_DN27459_c0_g1~~TRINITY_DN27459_c0_g1_i1.p1  ORF type:complete len:405 (+),score=79.92 TRINITY_DN27459_c0_g1_i1:44-1258(+)
MNQQNDRITETMEGIRNDLRSLHEATSVRYRQEQQPMADQIEGDVQHTAASLLLKTERMNELDRQDHCDAILRSVENKIHQFSQNLAALDEDQRGSKSEYESLIASLTLKVTKCDNSQQDQNAFSQKLKSAAEQQESRLRQIEQTLHQSDTNSRITCLEKNVATLVEELASVTSKVERIRQQQTQTDAAINQLRQDLSSAQSQSTDLNNVKTDIAELKKYNEEFMELSKQSSTTFEGEIDSRLSAFDIRYTALLKNYHSRIMCFVNEVQASMDTKSKSIYSTLEHDVNKLTDDITATATECRTVTTKLDNDIKTLSRRLLSGLRLLKDKSLDPVITTPQSSHDMLSTPSRENSAFTPSSTPVRAGLSFPTPSPRPSQQQPLPSSVTAGIDQFLKGLETLSSGTT